MKRGHHTPRHSKTRHKARQHRTPHRSAPPTNAPRQGTPRRGTPRHDTAQHDTTGHSTARRSQPRHGNTHHGTTRRGTARQSRAHRNTAQTGTAHHRKSQLNTARHTKAHHSTRVRDTNQGFNPSKPPHAPEERETRQQPWVNATPARRIQARGRRTSSSNGDIPPAQAATRKLEPAPQGGGTQTTPPPLTQGLTKPPGATAQPAEPELNPTGEATRPSVYITQPTHGAGARLSQAHHQQQPG